MSITLDAIALPEDLFWSDETTPWRVAQTVTPSVRGVPIVQESALQAGRPITLESQREGNAFVGMVSRATVDALLAKEAVPGAAAMTLSIPRHDGSTSTYQVRWRRTDGPAVEATFMTGSGAAVPAPIRPTDWYSITLRLMQV